MFCQCIYWKEWKELGKFLEFKICDYINNIMDKKILNIINSKPSAYRSMKLSQYGLASKNPNRKNDLLRWNQEKWLNLNALLLDPPQEIPCGRKYKNQKLPTVCRPSRKISPQTPSPLAYDLTRDQILAAILQKMQGKRILWHNL